MVTDNHYRWDFIQLADEPKPTPATSPKVANGSTLYTSDDSKLYVWYENQWYEKVSTGGGGIPTTVIDTIWFGTQAEYDAIETKAEKTLYLVQEEVVSANTLSASSTVLTLPKIKSVNTNILNNDVTPEVEIEEPQEEAEVEEEPEVVEESEEPQEEPQAEEPEEEENVESEE